MANSILTIAYMDITHWCVFRRDVLFHLCLIHFHTFISFPIFTLITHAPSSSTYYFQTRHNTLRVFDRRGWVFHSPRLHAKPHTITRAVCSSTCVFSQGNVFTCAWLMFTCSIPFQMFKCETTSSLHMWLCILNYLPHVVRYKFHMVTYGKHKHCHPLV